MNEIALNDNIPNHASSSGKENSLHATFMHSQLFVEMSSQREREKKISHVDKNEAARMNECS